MYVPPSYSSLPMNCTAWEIMHILTVLLEIQGYLRLGQILRRDQKPAIAFQAYTQGAALVADKYPDDPRLEKMREQAGIVEKVMHKVDPILTLPLELINMIFTQLTTTEIW